MYIVTSYTFHPSTAPPPPPPTQHRSTSPYLLFFIRHCFCFVCFFYDIISFPPQQKQKIKFGIEPAVKRIGEFKSFGDSYSRDSMSAAQREVSTNLLETASAFRTDLLARSAGKSVAEVEALYDSDVSDSPVRSSAVECRAVPCRVASRRVVRPRLFSPQIRFFFATFMSYGAFIFI